MEKINNFVKGKRCPECRNSRHNSITSTSAIHDGRPEYKCLACGITWTSGKKPGQGFKKDIPRHAKMTQEEKQYIENLINKLKKEINQKKIDKKKCWRRNRKKY